MLYNSYPFILVFLPTVFLLYFFFNSYVPAWVSKVFLVTASLVFYGYWKVAYVPLILASLVFNFFIGRLLSAGDSPANTGKQFSRKAILTLGVISNLSLLGYYKYSDFLISNINHAFGGGFELLDLTLPLAISFFTFQQIAYLVDMFRLQKKPYHFLDYSVFVTFFPQLIAGPIVHHKEFMPQLQSTDNKRLDYENIAKGVFIFSIGLFKKVILADTFASSANTGFSNAENLTLISSWITSLSYTFQLYFDFSGYADMAIGIALLFNIRLPINFNSPYKALSIQDFWRRWHITLSSFLRDYLYIPMGGNRLGSFRAYQNIFLTFLLGGIWHGAGWSFVFWGALHGGGLVIQRVWRRFNITINRFWGWFLTFNFVNVGWVFFRAEDLNIATDVLKAMVGLNGVVLPTALAQVFPEHIRGFLSFGDYLGGVVGSPFDLGFIGAGFVICLMYSNSNQKMHVFSPKKMSAFTATILFSVSLVSMNKVTEFLYFNF